MKIFRGGKDLIICKKFQNIAEANTEINAGFTSKNMLQIKSPFILYNFTYFYKEISLMKTRPMLLKHVV